MQLKTLLRRRRRRNTQVGASLAAATCALLGTTAQSQDSGGALESWQFDTATLLYSESDGRVSDLSFNGLARKELKEDSFLSLSLALDALTGASPNGAVPSNSVQTFTRPSGGGSYRVAPGEQPLDDSFKDSRVALSATWQQPVGRLTLVDFGASLSDEFDYTHLGINARIARDFNNRNTTLSAGIALASDSIDPVGGSPIPLAAMLPASGEEGDGDEEDGGGVLAANKRGEESKDVVDLLLGVTQVIDRRTIVQVNYSLSQADGYLNDPYKLISVVDPVTGNLVPGPLGSGLDLYRYENRPDSRKKQSLFGLVKREFNGDVLETSYRYMTDDWGIDSHTLEARYRWDFGAGRFLQPHLRFYSQNAADFYQTVLLDGQPIPAYATSDYRLGRFDAVTVGIKYGQPSRIGEWSARLELYRQSGEPSSNALFGSLAGQDLYPDLTALIAQFSFKFGGR